MGARYFFLALLLLIGCRFSTEEAVPKYWSKEKQEARKARLRRKAQRVESITRYKKDCRSPEDTTYINQRIHLFNKEGQLIEERRLSASDQLLSRSEHAYDSAGHRISIKRYNLYNELSEIEQFDEQGYRTLWLRFAARGRVEKKITQITYNEARYIESTQTQDEKGQLISESFYSYYEGNILKEAIEKYYYARVPHLGERKRKRNTYDTERRLIESYTATPNDTTLLHYTYQNNSKGLLEVSEELNETSLIARTHYTYSSENHLQRKQELFFNPIGKEQLRAVTLYNNQQKPTLIIHTNDRGQEVLRENFRYNKQGLLRSHQQYIPNEKICFIYAYNLYPTTPP